MFMMVDVVANHMGQGAISSNLPSPLNRASSYHPDCDIDYNNQTSIEVCRIAGLPDLNTESSTIRTLLQDWVSWLVTEFSFDGIRIDTVKHVEHDFWPSFVKAAGVYAIGEVWDGSPSYVSSYASSGMSLLNYPIYFPMKNFYQQKGSAQAIVDMHSQIDAHFPDPTALGAFLDNHDNPRWLHQTPDASLLKNNLAYVLLARGIPIVYYGTEQSFAGGDDPTNREDLWRSNYSTDAELYTFIARLSSARKALGGLPDDDHTHLYVANNAYAWSRAAGNLVVLTVNTGKGTNGRYCFNAGRTNGAWESVLLADGGSGGGAGGMVTSDGDGNVCVSVTDGEPVVLLATGTGGGGDGNNGTVVAPTSTRASASASVSVTTGVSSSAATTACPSTVAVTFNARVETQWGDTVKVVGNVSELGRWVAGDAPALSAEGYTDAQPMWSGVVELPAGTGVSYKLVNARADGSITWESDPDRTYAVPECEASATVVATWR
jgi:alpha-amylase